MSRLKYAARAGAVARESGSGFVWAAGEALRAGVSYPSPVSIQTDWSDVSGEPVYTTIAPTGSDQNSGDSE